jgi:hypothetical protein
MAGIYGLVEQVVRSNPDDAAQARGQRPIGDDLQAARCAGDRGLGDGDKLPNSANNQIGVNQR